MCVRPRVHSADAIEVLMKVDVPPPSATQAHDMYMSANNSACLLTPTADCVSVPACVSVCVRVHRPGRSTGTDSSRDGDGAVQVPGEHVPGRAHRPVLRRQPGLVQDVHIIGEGGGGDFPTGGGHVYCV